MSRLHKEKHNINRVGWLRAAVLGANDGIVSTASLIVGVASAATGQHEVFIAGAAGLAAGALSMAAGEYVSVSSQSDTEKADLAKEKQELIDQPEFELLELAQTFVKRGVDKETALEVATQLTKKDALGAHAKEELGISEITTAKPLLAAITSAITFAIGAALPLASVIFIPFQYVIPTVVLSSLVFLAVLGALGAYTGGAPVWKSVARISFWGAVAMAITAAIGTLFGVAV